VAGGTRSPSVGIRETERSCGMVELLRGPFERDRRRVAGLARSAQNALVRIPVARGAGRRRGEKRPRAVAGAAASGQLGVSAVERKARIAGMVKTADVERTELGIAPHVLHVTRDAVGGHIAVYAATRRDPLGHRLVAAQAAWGGDTLSRLVTAAAAADAFQVRVKSRERTWRRKGPELTCVSRHGQPHEDRDRTQPCQSTPVHDEGP